MYPNYLLFWELIKYSCENGFLCFDFGRSIANDGTYLFKEGWGAKPMQLYYQYYTKKEKIIDTSKSNPKRQFIAKIWKRLPLPVSNILGPRLRGNFP